MLHEPAAKTGVDNASDYKSSLGLKMFAVYGLLYAVYVAITIFKPELMGEIVFMGLNLAITYGIGLIVFAVVFGLLYNYLCTKKENELNIDDKETK